MHGAMQVQNSQAKIKIAFRLISGVFTNYFQLDAVTQTEYGSHPA